MSVRLQTKDKIGSPRIVKVSPFRKGAGRTEPHRHNGYFEFIYLTQGYGHHYIDDIRYEVLPHAMYFIRREQVHHWELSGEPEGFVCIIHKQLMEDTLDGELKALVAKVSQHTCLLLEENLTVRGVLGLLAEETKAGTENQPQVIEGLLKVLLAKVLAVSRPAQASGNLRPDLYHTFLELLASGGAGFKKKIGDYAGMLNTSPQNLNAACRRAAGLSATEVLSRHVVSEAKRMLLYTSSNVAEISYLLGFQESSHFIKYFKRHTGYTPQAFRKLPL